MREGAGGEKEERVRNERESISSPPFLLFLTILIAYAEDICNSKMVYYKFITVFLFICK